MKQQKAVKFWVTRNCQQYRQPLDVLLWARKPFKNTDGINVIFSGDRGFIKRLCHADFTRFTGLDVEPGECLRIQISVDVVSGGKE